MKTGYQCRVLLNYSIAKWLIKLKIGCQWVLSFDCVVTLELHYCSCTVNSKAMSSYCKKDLISILPALMACRRLSCLYLGQMFTRDFPLEQGGTDKTEKNFPRCHEGDPTIPQTLVFFFQILEALQRVHFTHVSAFLPQVSVMKYSQLFTSRSDLFPHSG